MIAGNKSDLATSHREIVLEDVSEWLYCELPKMRAKVFECSAKIDHNVSLLFKTLLQLSRIMPVGNGGIGGGTSGSTGGANGAANDTSGGGLKRRSSAYVSATSKGNCRCIAQVGGHSAYWLVACIGKGRVNSPSLSTEKSRPDLLAETSGEAKLKPRSRSLIRRSSRKTKQQIQNANSEDCNVQ